jgi:hypothetical protein
MSSVLALEVVGTSPADIVTFTHDNITGGDDDLVHEGIIWGAVSKVQLQAISLR